jgi:hypothetical protein
MPSPPGNFEEIITRWGCAESSALTNYPKTSAQVLASFVPSLARSDLLRAT